PIVTAVARRVIEARTATDAVASLRAAQADAIHVILCGTAAPLPDPTRSGPCTAIVTKTKLLVVDAGSGAARTLLWLGVRVGDVDSVLLTHYHSDHIDGLGELLLQRWAGGARREPLPVYGPPGVERVVAGLNEAYALDEVYRVAHHGPEIVPPSGRGGEARPFAAPERGEDVVLLEEEGLRVGAFAVDHDPVHPAVGYRFDYGGRSVVISGDTAKSANLTRVAKQADVLVHEGLAPHLVALVTDAARAAGRTNVEKITRDILSYHASPVEAAEVARDAEVRMLVFTHVIPPLPIAAMESLFLKGVSEVWRGPVVVGRDGMTFTLPAGGAAIERGTL
ncbi:MAG: MBL fold metallo-hydrolase, partial [Candidatus Binatia bacterium]